MSWGPGQYSDYILKVKAEIKQNNFNLHLLKVFLQGKWEYVRQHANVKRTDFIQNFFPKITMFHTKQLLVMMKLWYKKSYQDSAWHLEEGTEYVRSPWRAFRVFYTDLPIFTFEELKEELKNRPHIPNKVEARKIRQLKAKEKRNR